VARATVSALHPLPGFLARLLLHPALLTEFEEALAYPKLAKAVAASGLTPAQLLQRYLRLAVEQAGPITPTVLADPDDDHVLACAFAAPAIATRSVYTSIRVYRYSTP